MLRLVPLIVCHLLLAACLCLWVSRIDPVFERQANGRYAGVRIEEGGVQVYTASHSGARVDPKIRRVARNGAVAGSGSFGFHYEGGRYLSSNQTHHWGHLRIPLYAPTLVFGVLSAWLLWRLRRKGRDKGFEVVSPSEGGGLLK